MLVKNFHTVDADTVIMELSSMVAPQKTENRATIWSSSPLLQRISERIKIGILEKYLHSHVCCGAVHTIEQSRLYLNLNRYKNVIYIYVCICDIDI